MRNNRFILFGITMLLGLTLLLAGCGQSTPSSSNDSSSNKPAQDPVELKMVGYWPTNAKEWHVANSFIDQVNKELAGKVKITVMGGPELIPQTELANAVRTGAIDMGYATASAFVSLVPEADAVKLTELTPEEMRKNGATAFIDKMFREKANSHFLGLTMYGNGFFHLYTKQKLEKADLSGLIFRSIPIYEPLLKALGAQITTLPGSEIITSMDRKVITGFAYPIAGAFGLGYGQAAKYVLTPGFYAPEASLTINLDKWNKLPKDVQETIDKLAAKAEIEAMEWTKGWEDEDAAALKKQGVEFVELPAGEKEKFIQTARETGWAKIKERTPQNWEQLQKLLAK